MTIRVPYPTRNSTLARCSHMYICQDVQGDSISFVKCQTQKPKQSTGKQPILLFHYVAENPDPNRNPFVGRTIIDCDKLFQTTGIQFDDRLKTTIRPDISQELMAQVDEELFDGGYENYILNADELLSLNPLTRRA